MTKQASIAYLSDLMDHPGRITDADMNSIGGFRQSFPYFVPARYLEAYNKNKSADFSPSLLSSMSSYMGDWMMFCDFLKSDATYDIKTSVADVALEAVEVVASDNVNANELSGIAEALVNTPEIDAAISKQLEAVIAPPVSEIPEVLEMVKEPAITMPAEQAIPQVDIGIVEIGDSSNADEIFVAQPAEVADSILAEATPAITAIAQVDEEEVVVAAIEPVVVDTEISTPLAVEAHTTDDVFASLLDHSSTHEPSNAPEVPLAEGISERLLEDEAAKTVSENNPTNAVVEPEDAFLAMGAPAVGEGIGKDQAGVSTAPVGESVPASEKPLIYPVYTEDYFLQQGEKIPADMPLEIDSLRPDEHRSLMVMMSFSEWLLHFKSTTERQKEEHKDQRALKTMWQKEKLAAAIEEENEEIPENVFEMAVNSITREDGLMSESLAEIYVKQGKLDKALEMYRKLSLRNPQKNAYFADKIKEILKENQS